MTTQDAEFLLARPEFRRFLFEAIQRAGILGDNVPADEHRTRDFLEGRRSLGLEILRMADMGQPEQLRSGEAIATLHVVLRETLNPEPKGTSHGNSTRDDRYSDID